MLRKYADHASYVSTDPLFLNLLLREHIGTEALYNSSRHYNPRGNRLYAEIVASVLKRRPWQHRTRVFSYDKEKNAFLRK
ncbi:MAG: hypothetical protein GX606_01045 [Elusimicrobia bacterium]|nr:hypothetical protein [Elusimicrobiota bacterium]